MKAAKYFLFIDSLFMKLDNGALIDNNLILTILHRLRYLKLLSLYISTLIVTGL